MARKQNATPLREHGLAIGDSTLDKQCI